MDRQMIQPDHETHHAYVLSSRMLEIIRSESVGEHFVTVLENNVCASVSPISEIRRLSIVNSSEKRHDIDIPESVTMSRIRSLYIFGSVGRKLSFRKMNFWLASELQSRGDLNNRNAEEKLTFQSLTFLRVLDLQGCKDLKNHNVKEIAELRELRYLSFRDTPISEIPDEICQLQNLTTLDLRGTEVRTAWLLVFRSCRGWGTCFLTTR